MSDVLHYFYRIPLYQRRKNYETKEKSIVYHPEYKGVRLDIYAKDDKKTHYNVEMQVVQKPELEKRTRYYHSQIDMELLLSGQEYTELPDDLRERIMEETDLEILKKWNKSAVRADSVEAFQKEM